MNRSRSKSGGGGHPRWFVRGDADGLAGLFVDNLLQLLLIAVLCPLVCGLPMELIISRILPAAAISILFGNVFYSWQAWRLAKASGRDDVTALPYGINTVSLIAYIFLIMGPVWRETGNIDLVWQAGIFACLAGGALELAGAFIVDPIRRFFPRAALLATLAGIAITFIAMGFAFQIFASPAVALVPMMLIVLGYATKARLPFGFPVGLAAIVIGALTAWGLRWAGLPSFTPSTEPLAIAWHFPKPDIAGMLSFTTEGGGWKYFSVIFPMALFNVMGSLQSLDSAEAAGDRYETRSSLAANGIGSLVAGILGSPFPTTIYIGHPAWKGMGARIGYSAVNGVLIAILCFTGTATLILRIIPLEATLGILIWIGVVMAAQAFQESPKSHALAVAMGLIPALGAWAFLLIDTTLQATGTTWEVALPKFGSALYIDGVIALNQGFLLSSLLIAAITAFAIDRRLFAASVCAFSAAALSAGGLLHGWELSGGQVVAKFGWMAAGGFAASYAALGLILLLVALVVRRDASVEKIGMSFEFGES